MFWYNHIEITRYLPNPAVYRDISLPWYQFTLITLHSASDIFEHQINFYTTIDPDISFIRHEHIRNVNRKVLVNTVTDTTWLHVFANMLEMHVLPYTFLIIIILNWFTNHIYTHIYLTHIHIFIIYQNVYHADHCTKYQVLLFKINYILFPYGKCTHTWLMCQDLWSGKVQLHRIKYNVGYIKLQWKTSPKLNHGTAHNTAIWKYPMPQTSAEWHSWECRNNQHRFIRDCAIYAVWL